MRALRIFYHFLGSVPFAVALIASMALFVIIGTFLESATDSHRYAADFTYASPLFTLLLGLFFVNILVAALRRWPFRRKHIPFLITHLGLLMLLAGAIGKQIWGLQGTLSIVEGSASNKLLVSNSHALEVSMASSKSRSYLPVIPGGNGDIGTLDRLKLQSLEWRASSHEHLELWIKGAHAHVNGLPPIPVKNWTKADYLADSVSGRLGESEIWSFQAYRTPEIDELAIQTYLDGMFIEAVNYTSAASLGRMPLSDALFKQFVFEGGKATATLNLDFTPLNGFGQPKIILEVQLTGHQPETIQIALQGPQALMNANSSNPLLGSLPVRFDLKRQPTVVIAEDAFGDNHLWCFDTYGSVGCQQFRPHALEQLISYHSGFGGYAVESDIIPSLVPRHRLDREKAMQASLSNVLMQPFSAEMPLIPPLQLWVDACKKTHINPAKSFVELLTTWDGTHGWLLDPLVELSPEITTTLQELEWTSISPDEVKACQWTADAIEHVQARFESGESLSSIIHAGPANLQGDGTLGQYMHRLTAELFAARTQLPPAPKHSSNNATLFSAYLRAYGIHLQELTTLPDWPASTTRLETPVTRHHVVTPPQTKLEDNQPLVLVGVSDGTNKEKVPLTFDRYATGLRWPILGGHYLVRFQPMCCEIPYRVRLHDARQINHPNGAQPFSYEARITITDKRTGMAEEALLSMNHVHETWDGYRFYLSNIAPGNETAVRQVQIIVNHDPYKYWLTYPGAIALSLGILLLFAAHAWKD